MSNATVSPQPSEVHNAHHVEFYEGNNNFIYDSVAEFLAAGLLTGQPVVVISTPEQREGISKLVTAFELNLHHAVADGQLKWLDDRETLSKFMVGELPERDLFQACVGGVLNECRAGREHL